jgi:imidazolonepropionase-like amidohydrolase
MKRALVLLACCLIASAAAAQRGRGGFAGPVTIHALRVLDGRGANLGEATVTVENGKISRVEKGAASGPVTYDLGDATLMPGLIDVHVHLNWYFNRQGRYHDNSDGDTPAQSMLATVDNAYATLLSGITTIQSPGDVRDTLLRAWFAAGSLPGPRVITSLQPISPRMGRPDSGGRPATSDSALRASVRQHKAQGADFIKIFASASIRDGGAVTVTQSQMDALCGEAKSLGLRTLVHAHSPESVRISTMAGCSQIEHGMFVTDAELKLMADKHTYFDPQACLVLRNYLDNRAKYDGIGNFNEAGFAAMQKALPTAIETFRKAIKTPGLKVLFGTDAVAGAHGRNVEELICRVNDAGQSAMDAIVSATSLNSESLGLDKEIGTIAPGYDADLTAVRGDVLKDITTLRAVKFVMKGGRAYRNDK